MSNKPTANFSSFAAIREIIIERIKLSDPFALWSQRTILMMLLGIVQSGYSLEERVSALEKENAELKKLLRGSNDEQTEA